MCLNFLKVMCKNYLVVVLLILGVKFSFAQNGTVKGTLLEELKGEMVGLPFANVFLEGTTTGSTSDFDGNFSFTAQVGKYVIVASFMGYETFKQAIEIVAGTDITVKVEMKPEGVAIEGVTVVAKVNRESEVALMLEQKKASIIKESIGARQLSSLGVSDAAAATTKISGVNKNESSGDVYVRGLGDRYLSTTMNGLPIPSDDVEKKNIDLNLFSTDIIQSVGISKTFAVESYGDQTSGAIDISSKAFSDKIVIGLSTGSNSNVLSVFNAFRGTQNNNNLTYGLYSKPYETTHAVQKQSWNTVDRSLPLNYAYSILAGKKTTLFNHDLSIFATASHSASSEYKSGTYQKYRNNEVNEKFTDVEEFSTKINTTALLNLSYDMDENNNIKVNSLAIVKSVDELYEAGRNATGYYFEQTNNKETDSSIFVRDQNIKTTNIFINQLLGTHEIGDKNTLKWASAYNIVNSDEPSRIRNMLTILDDNAAEFIWVGGTDQRKTSQTISDAEINAYLKNEYRFINEESKKLKLNVGGSFRHKSRGFESSIVGVQAKNLETSSIDNMDVVFLNLDRYANDELDIIERTPDTYDASLLVGGAYLNFGWQFSDFSGSMGARYEIDNLAVSWDVGNYVGRLGEVNYEYNNLLPSLNLKYQMTEKNALRFAASQTITLPEFKELAPFEYVSASGRVTKGNPDLISSKNYNLDLKWEMFPTAKELVSATAFYKLINDPINKAQKRGSSGTYYFANTGEKATVYGVEVEGRFFIIESESDRPTLKLSFNATKMWFTQDLYKDFQYKDITETGLQGASDMIINGSLTFSTNTEKEFMATIVGNYSSDKIYVLGVPEDFTHSATMYNSAIMEKGFVSLDFVASKKLSHRVAMKLYGKNLLNPSIKQTQKVKPLSVNNTYTATVLSYKKGVQFGLSVNINLN